MKLIFIFLPIFLYAESFPSWFMNSDHYKNCGVGSGYSKLIAKINAKAYLSNKIKTNVDSNIEIYNKKNYDSFKSEATLKSKQLIKDMAIVKEERINNTYYIMMCQKSEK